jgi:lipopolysaccharide biosynthesis regulator YciM
MKFKANTNLSGVHNAYAGQEFEVTNEAEIQALLHQGVATPMNAQPEEIAKYFNLAGEQFAQAKAESIEEKTIKDLAMAEAVDFENNQQADKAEQTRQAMIDQMKQQASQQVKTNAQQEQAIKKAVQQAEQTISKAKQEQAIQQAQFNEQVSKQMSQARQQGQSQSQTTQQSNQSTSQTPDSKAKSQGQSE